MKDVVVPATTGKISYVDWASVIAGAVLAAAISFVLLTAGAAIGLSLVSADGPSHNTTAAYLAAFWAIAVPIGSLLAGGYIAGRMRAAWDSPDEVGFRDGIHGALVWAASVLIGAFLALSAADMAGRAGATVAAGAANAAQVAAPAVDSLLRSQPAAAGQQRPALTAEQQAQIGRILASSVRSGALSEGDKAYLTQTVAQVTGVPAAEAEKRVTDAYNATVQAVETARKAAVATGLVTATALLMGLVAAWYAAQRGGYHRDTSRPARFFT